MMKALKILGSIIGVIAAAVFVFWFGWLRAPSHVDVCEHLGELAQAEPTKAKRFDRGTCEIALQPPGYGRNNRHRGGLLGYTKEMKCMRDADSFSEADSCGRQI